MITEILVVFSLIAMLLGVLLPTTSTIRNMVASKTAIHSIASAVTAARAFATLPRANLQDSGDPSSAGFTFSGAAVLFTPAGEMRLVDNQQDAINGLSDPLEPKKNGYSDITGRDYLQLPPDTGVVGIARGGNLAHSDLYLLAPPFAVRYNEHGHLIAAVSTGHRLVYYDGNYDGKMTISNNRGENYNPDTCDPSSPTFDPSCWHTDAHRYKLPFEEIETVIGVVVYSKKDLRHAGFNHVADVDLPRSVNALAKNWILANGDTVFFSRFTGTVIRRNAS